MGVFDFDWFDEERIVQVGGGVSRVREDAYIRNTTGLIVNAATMANHDLSEAIRLNEMTGTISSFKRFDRVARASSTIGSPTTSFTYSTINKEQLAGIIRASISQAYPVAADIEDEDVSSGAITSANHYKYALQENRAYNLTTNIFTQSGVQYYFDSYADQFSGPTHIGYTINGHRNQITTTTITDTYTVFYGTAPGFPTNDWRIHINTVTDTVITYVPAGTTSSSSTSVDTYSSYDQIGDPWGLMPLTGTVVVCGIPAWSSLCVPTVSAVSVAVPISFTLAVPLLPATASIAVTDTNGDPVTVVVDVEYWVVYYTSGGRRYIWIADLTSTGFSESPTAVNENTNPELRFASIIPIRNDRVNITAGAAFTEATKALALIGLEPTAINAQITQPEVEDVYITLFSNLISTHMDQLAYNYAFFEYMDGFGVIDYSTFTAINNSLLADSTVYPFSKLSVEKTGVYNNNTSWGYIKKTEGIGGVLGAEYTYSLVDPGVTQWRLGTAVGDYTIRKRTSPTTYDEIFVKNIAISYTVFASAGDVKGFSVPVTTAGGAQVVIPFSYLIALSLPGKYRETLFLRCMHVGVFSKSVQVIEWYQQEWFSDLITIAAIIYAAYSTDWTAVANALEAAAEITIADFAALGIDISLSAATLIVIAQYAVSQLVLKIVLAKILSSGGNSSFFKFLAIVSYAYISIQMSGGDSLSTVKQALIGGKAVFEGNNILVQNNLQKEALTLSKELETYKGIQEKLDSLQEQSKAIDAMQANATQALDIKNMFQESGKGYILPSDIDASDQRASIEDQIDMISKFVSNALKLIDPETLILESETLLA